MEKEWDGRRWKTVLRTAFSALAAGALLIGVLAACSSAKRDNAGAQTADVASGGAATASTSDAKPAAQAAEKGAAAAANDAAKAADKNESLAKAAGGDGQDQSVAAAGVTPPIAADSGDGFNRKLIYKANLVMEVPDYGDAQTKLRDLAALSGAFILQFTETTNSHEKSGNYTIKVAAKGFASFLDGLEKISPSLQRSVQGQDVTEEYVDLDARLKAKQAVEARLLAFMDKAQKTEDLVAFSNELSKVQTEIEQIKGRMRYLDQNVALSTIDLRMYEKLDGSLTGNKPGTLPFGERVGKALNGTLDTLGVIAQGLIVFLAGALPVLFILAILFAVYLMARKRRSQKLTEIRTGLKREQLPAASQADEEHRDEDKN
jgi:hypothetical protein